MFETVQEFRKKLDAGQICLGSGITLGEPAVTEALGDSVDFFWIDLEHSHLHYESVHAHLIAARAAGKPAFVRVRGSNVSWIKSIVDIGADGIIVPQVCSAVEVQGVVDACRYPPKGRRGYGPRRASRYGRNSGPEQIKEANQWLFVSVQIENSDALSELDAIVAVEGLDSVVIGPYDLAFSMGYDGEINHPQVVEAMTTIIRTARQAGKYVGMGTGPSEVQALRAIEMGAQWLQCGDDFGFMVQRADELFGRIRSGRTE